MLIAIDHGNKQIKTRHKTFASGLMESSVRPLPGDEFLFYNEKYYSMTDRRDKTTDESYLRGVIERAGEGKHGKVCASFCAPRIWVRRPGNGDAGGGREIKVFGGFLSERGVTAGE